MKVSAIRLISYGYAAVRVKEDRLSTPVNGCWMIISRTGKALSQREFLCVGHVKDGVVPVRHKSVKTGKEVWSLLSMTTGEFYLDEEYDFITGISDGVATVFQEGRGYTFVDVTGAMGWNGWRSERIYFKEASQFWNDVGVVQLQNGKYTYVTRGFDCGAVSFFKVLDREYPYAANFRCNMSVVRYRKDCYGYVQRRNMSPLLQGNGELMTFSHVRTFTCGRGLVQNKDGLYNYIDERGRMISDRWFVAAEPFYAIEFGPDLLKVVAPIKYREKDGWTLIDEHGAELFNVERFTEDQNTLEKTVESGFAKLMEK